jgi:glycosyltransferase involved in cell wall biosynthesis
VISILCPTRGRVPEFTRMLQSLRDTAAYKVEVLAYVDEDDPQKEEYRSYDPQFGEIQVKVKVGPRLTLTKCWNELLPLATGNILMQGNDDIVFKTTGWQKIVEETFSKQRDRLTLAFGDDCGGYHEMKFGPHPFVHRRWVETLGYFIPPYFSSDFGDTWINELGVAVNHVKKLPIEIEHLHFIYGKAQQDRTTLDRLERHKKDDPEKLYNAMSSLRDLDVRKLKNVDGLSDAAFAGKKTTAPKLDILILTQYSRAAYLERLLEVLAPQVVQFFGNVDIKVEMFEPAFSLGANRERLRQRATAEYICFIDDDDLVPPDYVQKILPKLTGVDYVGFKLQCYLDGVALPVTRHSLRFNRWGEDQDGAFRDISHVNPMRRELALKVPMEGGFAEDSRWADRMRDLDIVKTEAFISDVMYFYHSRTDKVDGVKQELPPPPPKIYFEPQKAWRPTHFQCPNCQSTCVVQLGGGLRCNQCAHQFR